jgi:hypothetical protein
MKKALITLTFIVAYLLFSMSTVGATIDMEPGGATILVGQSVEFTVKVTDWGKPPYNYQWFTQLYPNGEVVAVPGANSSTFNFTGASPGTYGISINITDSEGNYDYAVFLPSGIWVFVLESPTPTPTMIVTPTPSSEPTPVEPFPAALIFVASVGIALAVIGLFMYFKKFHRKKSV